MHDLQDSHSKRLPCPIAANHPEPVPLLTASDERVAAALLAVNEMGNIVSSQCFSSPASLTQERITAYALSLIRLRECANTAGLERLTKACDALAVTVSRLIDDRSCACQQKCEVLKRFVVHAREMIEMSIGRPRGEILPLPDGRATDRCPGVARNAHVPVPERNFA